LPEEALVKRAGVALTLTVALAFLTGCNVTTRPHVVREPKGHTVLTVSDNRNGQTVVLRTGEQLRVDLASTYWSIQPPTNMTVLSPQGDARVLPQLDHCVPGGGCGHVIQVYVATTIGRSSVTATRSSCGEAMGCTPAASRFQVLVTVRR
jgi:hypothetical protein